MKTLKFRLFLLTALIVGLAMTATARPSYARNPFCTICAKNGDCFSCCRCDGGSGADCAIECGGAVQ